MLTTVLRTAILMAAMLADCLQVRTLDDIRALEAGRTGRGTLATNSLSLPENEAATIADHNVQNISPVWYLLSDNRKMKVQDWKAMLFMQSACPYCHQFAPVPKAFPQKTSFDVSPISLDGKDDAEFPDMLPATPDVMVEYFQSSLPVTTPTTFLTNINTMET